MCIKKIKSRFDCKKNTKKLSDIHRIDEKVVKYTPKNECEWQQLSAFVKSTFSHLPETPLIPLEEEIEEE